MTDKEKAYFDARDAERRELQAVREAINDSSVDSEVIDMVKQSEAPGAAGTTEEWLKTIGTVRGGTVMFPEWSVSRRALHKFDVRFTYTLIDVSNHVAQAGYSWQVDTILRSVGPPRDVSAAEAPSTGRLKAPPMRTRFSDKDLSLE